MVKAKKQSYTPEFRAKVLEAVKNREGETIGDVAARFKIRPGIIYSWQRAAEGRPDYRKRKSSGPRKALKRYSVAGWMKFSLAELRKERPNIEVARAYLTLAEHAMEEEVHDG